MTPSSAPSGPIPRMLGEEQEEELERTARLTMEILEDLRLADRIAHALHATGYSELRNIEVSVDGPIVRIVGRVPSYYLKQIAQATALAVPEIHQVQNRLEVVQAN